MKCAFFATERLRPSVCACIVLQALGVPCALCPVCASAWWKAHGFGVDA